MKLRKKKGVTLIELLIVLSIIGLLAAVAIPKYSELLEKANLGATIGNLASLRSSLSIYYSTYMELPGSIDPADEPQFGEVLNGDVPLVKARYPYANSPYGRQVTVATNSTVMPTGPDSGWFYNNTAGVIYINSTEMDIKGLNYTTY